MRLKEIPEAWQRIIKWAMDGKEAVDVEYLDYKTGARRAVTATIQDAKGERLWLVTTPGDTDVIFGYTLLVDVAPAVGFPAT